MDSTQQLQQQVKQALADKQPLAISAGHSKDFYGREITGRDLSLAQHSGIIDYDFRELVITVRSGTPLSELVQVLSGKNQVLAFEPPLFSAHDTIGGLLACGLSGPGRPYFGSARDFVLGCHLLNGKAEKLKFGGQVMKNVAGYDVSRLMIGAMGTLGVLLDVSLKVLPGPEMEKTLVFEKPLADALAFMNQVATQRLPVTATAYYENRLYLRLSGMAAPVASYLDRIKADAVETDSLFWQQLKDHRLAFFDTDQVLWRISVPPSAPKLALSGQTLYEWRGALRWFIADDPGLSAQQVMDIAAQAGGHATQFKNADRQSEVFSPLPDGLKKYHLRLKQAMDPEGVFNPGRLYSFL